MYSWLYQPNMCLKFIINRIKIDRVIALTLVRKTAQKTARKSARKSARKIFPPTALEKKIDTSGDHQGS